MSEELRVSTPRDPDKLEIRRFQSRVRWSGFLILGAALVLIVYIGDRFGKTAAEVSAVTLLAVGMVLTLWQRHRSAREAGDFVEGSDGYLAGDCGDGGGGGDC